MFHWICPECGREIPPAVKECPACDPQAVITTPPELPKLAKTPVDPAPAARVPMNLKPGAANSAEAIHSAPVPHLITGPEEAPSEILAAVATALLEPPTYIPPMEPRPEWAGTDLAKRTQQLLPSAQVPLLLRAPSGTAGFTQVLLPPIVPNGLVLAVDHLAVDHVEKQEIPDLAALAEAVEAGHVETRAEEPPAAETPMVETPVELPMAVPEQAPLVALEKPQAVTGGWIKRGSDPGPALGQTWGLAPPQSEVPTVSRELQWAKNLLHDRGASPAPPIRLKFARTSEQEALPAQGSAPRSPSLAKSAGPATAGLVKYSREALKAMRAAKPSRVVFIPAAEPRTTLPGPALPKELNSLAEAGLGLVHKRPHTEYRRRYGARLLWLVLAVVVVFAAGALYILPALLVNGKPAPVQAEAPSSAPVTPPAGTYPLSKTIEVTGFRFVVDLNGKSEIHYLVVNHSAAQFAAVTVFVTLRDLGARPGQPPVARFSFRAPDMGPYSSREMTSPIEKMSRSVSLPDWTDLRAEVEIAE